MLMIKTHTLIAAILLLSGCSTKILLSSSNIDKYKLSETDLSAIQFYTTHDVVLNRYEQSPSEKSTEKGALNVNTGQQVEQVIIKQNTKGKIVSSLPGNKFCVSFEPDDSKCLVFGVKQTSDALFLQAMEWNEGRGKVQYGENIFYTSPGAEDCALSFRLKRAYKLDKKVRTAKGNKVR